MFSSLVINIMAQVFTAQSVITLGRKAKSINYRWNGLVYLLTSIATCYFLHQDILQTIILETKFFWGVRPECHMIVWENINVLQPGMITVLYYDSEMRHW